MLSRGGEEKIKNNFLLLLLIAFILFSWRSWEETVIFTDELFIEDGAYSMAHGSSLIIPQVNGTPNIGKPPLLYWLYLPIYYFFSPQPFIRRIWMIIFSLLLVVIVYQLSRKWYSPQVAFVAGLFLTTSVPLIYFSKTANYDLPNAFFITLAIYLFSFRNWAVRYLLTPAIFGLAILTRSFLALIPLPISIINITLAKDKLTVFQRVVIFLAVLLLVTIPWHILAYQENRIEFIFRYIQIPIFLRAFGILAGDTSSSPLFYLKLIFLFPPVLFVVWYGIYVVLKQKSLSLGKYFLAPSQIILWIMLYLIFLTVSTTRHEWYLLPIISPLSIAAGYCWIKILKIIKYASIRYYLLMIFTFAIVAGPSSLLFFTPFPEAEAVKAVKVLQKTTPTPAVFYIFKYEVIPLTRFYPKDLTGIVVNRENLIKVLNKKQPVFLFLRTRDSSDLPDTSKSVLFSGQNITLVKIE